MKVTFYIQCIFILFVVIISASENNWRKRYPEKWKGRLYMVLTKGFDKEAMTRHSLITSRVVNDDECIKDVQEVLKDAGKTPLDMYNILVETLQPEFATPAKDYYTEQRELLGVSKEFNEFDVKFYKKLGALIKSFSRKIEWEEIEVISSKEEVMCEAAYFYDLIGFEYAIICLDDAPRYPLNLKVFSNLVADMYFGEAGRVDFSYEDDMETKKWLEERVKKYEGSQYSQTASFMRRFTRNIRGKNVDDKLWNDYMRAMMTVHLSSVFIRNKIECLRDLHDYLAENGIQEEYMFASRCVDEEGAHAYLRTFKLEPNGRTATMGIVNSGFGIGSHERAPFELSKLPDTISGYRRASSVYRFIPFVVYEKVPSSDWGPAYTIVDTDTKMYFGHKREKHKFSDYKKWQYIDDQKAGTCAAMALWSGLYWYERESQQRLESFRLTLYLEVLREAAKELVWYRGILEGLDTELFELTDDDPGRNELQSMIKETSEEEDDYLRFFSVAFNSAIRSIRYLHTDPFEQGLNMTSVMQDYADFYESQAGEKYWQFVKPNIDDLFHSTYLRVVKPMIWITPSNVPKISAKEGDCTNEVNQAIESDDPFSFVKAVIGGTDLKCQGMEFLASIHSGINELDLQTHHQDLILRALSKEARSFLGGRLPILRLIVKLVSDYGFKLFPTYGVLPNTETNFIEESRQVFIFDEDVEMKQFAVNCDAFDLLGKNVLAAAYDLVKSTGKALPDLVTRVNITTTEEYKLHKNLIERAVTELQSMDPHLYARHLSTLIQNAEQTGITHYITSFKPSMRWDHNDYTLLSDAIQKSEQHKPSNERYIEHSFNYSLGLRFAFSHPDVPVPSDLSITEFTCIGNVSFAINMNSSLNFTKAVVSGMGEKCQSELFFFSITHGIESLELQVWHRDLILRALTTRNDDIRTIKFINKLITDYDFKLFPTNNTPRTGTVHIEGLFDQVSKLSNGIEAQQLVANLPEYSLPAAELLRSSFDNDELLKFRSNFVDLVFTELRSMNPHLYAYYLGILIRKYALEAKDFASITFKPSEEWDHYDYVLIENAVIHVPRREEYGKIFNFPTEYQIDTRNVRSKWEFDKMSPNPSNETLRDYATMLFNKMKDSYRK